MKFTKRGRRKSNRDTSQPAGGMHQRSKPGGEMEEAARQILASKGLVEAIKYVRGVTNWGLGEAKEYVEAIREGRPAPEPKKPVFGMEKRAFDEEVRRHLAHGRKIEAVRFVREAMNWGLKEAKDYVDEIERSGWG